METEVMKALDELGELLTAYHALATIRDSTRKATHTYAVADILAATLANDIMAASRRADILTREYLEAEDFPF